MPASSGSKQGFSFETSVVERDDRKGRRQSDNPKHNYYCDVSACLKNMRLLLIIFRVELQLK